MKKIKTSQKNRKCRYPLCKHVLSIYNHESYCHIHIDHMLQENSLKAAKV